MEPGDKKLMARRILGEYPSEYLSMLEFIDKYTDLQETPAQFQERCGQIALACFWREQEEEKKELCGPPEPWDETVVETLDDRFQHDRELNAVR